MHLDPAFIILVGHVKCAASRLADPDLVSVESIWAAFGPIQNFDCVNIAFLIQMQFDEWAFIFFLCAHASARPHWFELAIRWY